MAELDQLLDAITSTETCRVHPPAGRPVVPRSHTLPVDLEAFYDLCGGVDLFMGSDFSCSIVPPEDLTPASPEIVGEPTDYDISGNWYVIAREGAQPCVVIDLHGDRLGRCYDAFYEIYGLVGQQAVVARSFTELLDRLLANRGRRWYWLDDRWESLGDAYDSSTHP